jgi:hypothetical protein
MEMIEAKQGDGIEAGSAANIGQVLERIVQTPSQDSTSRKKLIFPRESVNAADFQIPKPGASRKSNEPAASSPATMLVRKPEPKKAETIKPKASHPNPLNTDSTSKSPSTQPVTAQKKATGSTQVPQAVAKSRPNPTAPKSRQTQAVASTQPRASSAVKVQTKKKVVAKAHSKEQVRRKDSVKNVLREKLARTPADTSGISTDIDLEAFMRDTERTEEREIRCNPQTMTLLQQIAARTGCDPSDIANQAVTGVAQAIQEAGFAFSLPMHAELKPRRK